MHSAAGACYSGSHRAALVAHDDGVGGGSAADIAHALEQVTIRHARGSKENLRDRWSSDGH